jgi:hypothetical protein
MRARGIVCLWYINNCLLCLPTRADALAARTFVESLFLSSGLTNDPYKGEFLNLSLELQDHFGFFISTQGQHCLLKVPDRHCRDIAMCTRDLLCQSARVARRVPSQILRSFMGKVSSISNACDQSWLRLRSLQDIHKLWLPTFTLTRDSLRDL